MRQYVLVEDEQANRLQLLIKMTIEINNKIILVINRYFDHLFLVHILSCFLFKYWSNLSLT